MDDFTIYFIAFIIGLPAVLGTIYVLVSTAKEPKEIRQRLESLEEKLRDTPDFKPTNNIKHRMGARKTVILKNYYFAASV